MLLDSLNAVLICLISVFFRIFAMDPEVMDRFPFLKELKNDDHVENNSRLQKHANIALLMVCLVPLC